MLLEEIYYSRKYKVPRILMSIFRLSSYLYWFYNPKHLAQFSQLNRSKSSIHPHFERIV
jgi:hypothetical protein